MQVSQMISKGQDLLFFEDVSEADKEQVC